MSLFSLLRPALAVLAVLWLFSPLLLAAPTPKLDLRRDTFAFSNDTVLAYGVDELGQLHIAKRDKPVEYGHRCFVLARAVLQFHQFARFDPKLPKVSRDEYRRRILKLCRIPVWSSGPRERIVFPGFADLRSFSIAYEGLLKENLGNWLPTYLRVGNWRMMFGHPRAGQAATARFLIKSCQEGRPRAVFLTRFPHMNHVVVIYDMHTKPNGDTRFLLYDPNYPNQPGWLDYVASQRSFDFQKRWYFPGGRVNLLRVYLSPFH